MQPIIHCSFTAAATAIPELSVSYSGACCSLPSSSEEKHIYKRNTALKIYWAFLTQAEVYCALNVNPSAVSSSFPLVFQNTRDFFFLSRSLPCQQQYSFCYAYFFEGLINLGVCIVPEYNW